MIEKLKNEPLLSAITGLVLAGIALVVAFGVVLTSAQTGAIVGFVVAVYVVIGVVRSKVTPTRKIKKE